MDDTTTSCCTSRSSAARRINAAIPKPSTRPNESASPSAETTAVASPTAAAIPSRSAPTSYGTNCTSSSTAPSATCAALAASRTDSFADAWLRQPARTRTPRFSNCATIRRPVFPDAPATNTGPPRASAHIRVSLRALAPPARPPCPPTNPTPIPTAPHLSSSSSSSTSTHLPTSTSRSTIACSIVLIMSTWRVHRMRSAAAWRREWVAGWKEWRWWEARRRDAFGKGM
mmetsp:Transcript_3332/g.9191  ORF Transcript_3332/g.9191 Transcript_3332/m.9191 type:complete len:229 (-) Transcript_3332:1448-2134(-)